MPFQPGGHHEVVQALPLDAQIYVCCVCGLRGSQDELFRGARCRPRGWFVISLERKDRTHEPYAWFGPG